MQLNQAPTKILQAASPGRDLHVSYFVFCFDNIGLYFYVSLRGSPTHPIYRYYAPTRVLMLRSPHQTLRQRELYTIILSESNDKT
jgi:hypothetical protein